MLDIQLFRENPDLVRKSLERRREDPSSVDQVIDLDRKRRNVLQRVENMRAEKNQASKAIGQTKDPDLRQEKISAMKALGENLEKLEADLKELEPELSALLGTFPNLVDDRVPDGADDSENQVLMTVGEPPTFDFQPQAHWDLGPALGILDFERGVKLSGTRFYVLNGLGARLQRALVIICAGSHRNTAAVFDPFPRGW
jgi:seryl-tRNA synthetase